MYSRLKVWLRLERDIWLLSFALCLLFFGSGMVTAFVMILIRTLGASFLMVGYVALLYNGILAFSFFLGASLSEKYGGKIIFVASLLCSVLAIFSFLVAWAWYIVAVGLIFGRLAWGFRWTSSFSIVSESADEAKRATAFGMVSTFQYLGGIIGPVVGGILAFHFGLRFPFFASAPLIVLSAAIVLFKMKVGEVKRGIVFSFDRIKKTFTLRKGITQLILINMLAMFFNEFGNPFYMIFLKENLKAPEYVIGLTTSALSIGALIAGFPGGVFSDMKRKRRPFIVFAYIVALTAVGITAFSWHPWMIVATFLLFGISNTITMNTVSAYFTDAAGQEKTIVYGVYTSLGWLCAIVSPIIAGFVAENYGLRVPFMINFAGLFVSTALLALFFKEK